MKNILIIAPFLFFSGTLAQAQTAGEDDNYAIVGEQNTLGEQPQLDQQPQSTLEEKATEPLPVSTERQHGAKFKKLPDAAQSTIDREFPGHVMLSSEIFAPADGGGSASTSYGVKLIYGDDKYTVEVSPEGKMISRLKDYSYNHFSNR